MAVGGATQRGAVGVRMDGGLGVACEVIPGNRGGLLG